MHRAHSGVLLLGTLLGSAGCPALFGADSEDTHEPRCRIEEVLAVNEYVLLKRAGETVTWRAAASFSGVGDLDARFERWWMASFSLVAASNTPETSEGALELAFGPVGAAPWTTQRIAVTPGAPKQHARHELEFVEPLAVACMGRSPCELELEVRLTSFTSAVVSVHGIQMRTSSQAEGGRYPDCGLERFEVLESPGRMSSEESGTSESGGAESETDELETETEGSIGGS